MCKLSNKAIFEFQEIYKKQYGRTLDQQEATDLGIRLLNLFKVIYKPIPNNEYKIDKTTQR